MFTRRRMASSAWSFAQSRPKTSTDMQLAHARAGVHGVYNRSHLLAQRRELERVERLPRRLAHGRQRNVVAIKSAAA